MDRKEKNERKASLSQYLDLSHQRFTDREIEQLESIVERRDEYNGASRTYRDSYRSFDSEDTYHVEEADTYTFHSDNSGIRIERDFSRDWDDGQHDTEHEEFKTGRGILSKIDKIRRRK